MDSLLYMHYLYIQISHTFNGEGNGNPLQYSCLEKFHGWRSLVGCSPWGCEELHTTERLHFHFSLSCMGEGDGNLLQCSCLENPRDGGAWWAAVYGVAQSRTRLKRLSSSSSSRLLKEMSMFSRSLAQCLLGLIGAPYPEASTSPRDCFRYKKN